MSVSSELGEQRTVELPHGTVAYRERGEGPPIVFVHGLLVNGDHWRKVVPLLADRYRCIAPDLPLGAHATPLREGADLSAGGVATLVADLIAKLDLNDVTIVSNDTGDAIAQVLVADHPERIARVVLTAGDAFTNFLPWLIKPLRGLGFAPGAFKYVARAGQTRIGLKLALVGVTKHMPPDAVADGYTRPAYENAGVRRDVAGFLKHASPRATLAAAKKLRTTDVQALVVWTKASSPLFPKAHGKRLAELIPDARYEEIADTRAFIPEDQPERLAELIGQFVPAGVRAAAA